MGEIIGRDIQVGFATEAVRGVAETSVDRWARNVTAKILERATHAQDDTRRGVLEDMQGRRVVQKYVEGNIGGIVHVDAIGFLFASIYGGVSTSLVGGSVYDHVFGTKQNIEHQSFSLFAKDGDAQQLVYPGCMASTLEINGTLDDYVRFTSTIFGRSAADDTSIPAYGTEYDFIGSDITVKMADSEAGLAGATAIPAKSINVKHDQGLIRDHVLGNKLPNNIFNAKSSIDGEFQLNFIDETYKDLYLSDDNKYMSITIQGDADLGGGLNPATTYVFNNVQIEDWDRDGGTDELVTQPIKFKAYYNEVDGKASTLTLRNLTSSYPNVPTV